MYCLFITLFQNDYVGLIEVLTFLFMYLELYQIHWEKLKKHDRVIHCNNENQEGDKILILIGNATKI